MLLYQDSERAAGGLLKATSSMGRDDQLLVEHVIKFLPCAIILCSQDVATIL